MAKLDYDFIRKAERVTSFNVVANDFQHLKYKEELQHLFVKHMYPKFDMKDTISGTKFTTQALNAAIEKVRHAGDISKLHNYNLKGIGPGEVLLYFVLDKGHLGGGSSKGVDLVVGTDAYEIKAVKSTGGFFSDFKLGGTVNLDKFKTDLDKLRNRLKVGGTPTEISGSRMKDIKQRAPDDYNQVEKAFRESAFNNYFKFHPIIFIENKPGNTLGKVLDIKTVKKNEIFMERVTSGTLKPLVKI